MIKTHLIFPCKNHSLHQPQQCISRNN